MLTAIATYFASVRRWKPRPPKLTSHEPLNGANPGLPCVSLANIQYCDTEMRFTWDPAKARKNQKNHGVSFATAAEIFDDPNHVVGDNYFMEETGEQRFQIIGMNRNLVA